MKSKILIILTSHRTDCFWLCMKSLEKHTCLSIFKVIYILANDVSKSHNEIIKLYKSKHRNIIDIHCSPRGLNGCVIAMQNIVLEKHKNDIIVKIDEDVFVTQGWLSALSACYERYKDTNSILYTPVIPNNLIGRRMLAPLLGEIFPKQYTGDLTENTVHKNITYGVWIWKKVIKYDLPKIIKNRAQNIPDEGVRDFV